MLPVGQKLLLQRLVLVACFDEDVEHEWPVNLPFEKSGVDGRVEFRGRADGEGRNVMHILGATK